MKDTVNKGFSDFTSQLDRYFSRTEDARGDVEKQIENRVMKFESKLESVARLESRVEDITRLDTRMEGIEKALNELRRTNWPLLCSFGGIAIVLITGAWGYTDLRIQNAISPTIVTQAGMRSELDGVSRALTAAVSQLQLSQQADANSKTDRDQLNLRVRALEASLATESSERNREDARTEAKLTEVETQFSAVEQQRNTQFSEQQRLNSMVFGALSGLNAKFPEYPRAPFFQPNISQQAALSGR